MLSYLFGRIAAARQPGYTLQFLTNRFRGLLRDFRFYPLRVLAVGIFL
jgi:hypothetical protein